LTESVNNANQMQHVLIITALPVCPAHVSPWNPTRRV